MTNATSTAQLPREIEQITAEWMTSVLSENYPGTVVTGLHIGTVIAGTATKIRLLLAYNEAGHRHQLPATMWLKGGFIRHGYTFDASFIAEAKFFASWAPEMNINIPGSYWTGWEEDQQGLVLLEDLAAKNVEFGLATRPITVNQQAQTLELLARMHARWWESPSLKTLKNYSTVWQAADKVVMMMLEPSYYNDCLSKRRCDAIAAPYRDRDRLIAGLRSQWAKSPNIPQCFSHGDAHLGNMYFETDGRPGFLDWQAWQEGPYMVDVAYSLIGNLTVECRRQNERDLLATYLAALAANGVETPPSLDDAWEAYRRHAMHGLMWAFTPTEMQPEDVVTAEGDRFGTAVVDLDTFGALGV
jgi:hypothetical protein